VLVYPEADKLGKQFKYAAQINAAFVCVVGETELAENKRLPVFMTNSLLFSDCFLFRSTYLEVETFVAEFKAELYV
jgi:histidyl-tRNA synthetase